MSAVKMVVGALIRDASIPASVWGMKEDGTVEWTYDTGGGVYFIKREPVSGNYYITGEAKDNGDGHGTRNVWILSSSGSYINGAYVGSSSFVYAMDLDSNYAYFGVNGGAYRTDLDLTNQQTIVASSGARQAIAVDSSGNIYVGGGGVPPTLAKYNSSFVLQWTEDPGSSCWDIKVLSNQDVVIGYYMNGQVIYYKSDGSSPTGGTWSWSHPSGSGDIVLEVDGSDNIYAFGSNGLGGIVKLNSSGVQQWFTATDPDLERAVFDSSGDFWVAGDYTRAHNIFKVDVSEQIEYGMMSDTNRSTTIYAIDIDPTFSFSVGLKDAIEGFWKMNDDAANTTVVDDSQNSRHGIATKNTSIMTTTGKINKALSFVAASSDQVLLGDVSVFDLGPNENKTIAFWYKWTENDVGVDYQTLMHKYDDTEGKKYGFAIIFDKTFMPATVKVRAHLYASDTSLRTAQTADNAGMISGWHLVVVRFDRSKNLQLSVDNRIYKATADISSKKSTDYSNVEQMSIAGNCNVNANFTYFDGAIDCVGFWSRVLTEEEEAQIWNGGSGTEDFGIIDPPVITEQDPIGGNINKKYGDNVTFSIVTVEGTPPFTYQWYKDDSPITGEISNTLTLFSVDVYDEGKYHCVVTNEAGSDQSDDVNLRIAPYITSQSPSSSFTIGQPASISVNAEGTLPFSYQWYKNDVLLPEETDATFSTYMKSSDAGTYKCFVSNDAGSVWSDPIVLTAVSNPYRYNLFNIPFDFDRKNP